MEDAWNLVQIDGNADYVPKEKLKFLKSKLKIWNNENFGIVDLNVDKVVSALNSLDLFVSNVFGGVN